MSFSAYRLQSIHSSFPLVRESSRENHFRSREIIKHDRVVINVQWDDMLRGSLPASLDPRGDGNSDVPDRVAFARGRSGGLPASGIPGNIADALLGHAG
jgi:hypothetical protein